MGWSPALLAVLAVLATRAGAVSDADKCAAAKDKIAGKYSFCRMKVQAKALKTGNPVAFSLCDRKYALKWAAAETNAGGMCPTNGDLANIQSQMAAATDLAGLKMTGARFVDNGDGTISDVQTGLMWEQKFPFDYAEGATDYSLSRDVWNNYIWTLTGSTADGGVFTEFVPLLNYCQSGNGSTISNGFAGYCDWRLPTVAELRTLLLMPFPCTVNPCIDPVLGPTQPGVYWTSVSNDADSSYAWAVDFSNGYVGYANKSNLYYARAVRGILLP